MNRLAALILGLLAVAATPAGAGPRLFPKAVYDAGGGAGFAERMDVAPLWRAGARGDRQRVRLFIGGHTIKSWSVELDRRASGRVVGVLREHNGRYVSEETTFAVRAADFAALQALVAEAGLWSIYPQFYVEAETAPGSGEFEVCIDGMTVVLERQDVRGYRYAEGNAQCTLGREQLQVVAKIFELSGRPGLTKALLPCCLDAPTEGEAP